MCTNIFADYLFIVLFLCVMLTSACCINVCMLYRCTVVTTKRYLLTPKPPNMSRRSSRSSTRSSRRPSISSSSHVSSSRRSSITSVRSSPRTSITLSDIDGAELLGALIGRNQEETGRLSSLSAHSNASDGSTKSKRGRRSNRSKPRSSISSAKSSGRGCEVVQIALFVCLLKYPVRLPPRWVVGAIENPPEQPSYQQLLREIPGYYSH